MKLELLTSSPIGEGPPLPNRLYFCLGCGSHREQFNPEECLYLYLNTAIGKTFVGFYCPNCHQITEQPQEEHWCVECGLKPVAHPYTELCEFCIGIDHRQETAIYRFPRPKLLLYRNHKGLRSRSR